MSVVTESATNFGVPQPLSAAEADRRLEKAVHEHERAEKLVCFYLHEIYRRKLYQQFGFENVYDYALERFGFSRTKTGALLHLAKRLCLLPKLTEALATGRIGWTKASKVASVATPESDSEWTDKAVESSYRDLERELRDGVRPEGGSVNIWMSAEQAALWVRLVELCRRIAGEEIVPGQCLELLGMEFLSTYEALEPHSEEEGQDSLGGEIDDRAEEVLCPETKGELPVPTASCYAEIHARVLKRDGYRCAYSRVPGAPRAPRPPRRASSALRSQEARGEGCRVQPDHPLLVPPPGGSQRRDRGEGLRSRGTRVAPASSHGDRVGEAREAQPHRCRLPRGGGGAPRRDDGGDGDGASPHRRGVGVWSPMEGLVPREQDPNVGIVRRRRSQPERQFATPSHPSTPRSQRWDRATRRASAPR